MVDRKDLLRLEYYNHNPFTGSEKGLRYRVEKIKDGEQVFFLATVWPEPYAFDHTPEDQKESKRFPFSDEGLNEVTKWLNEKATMDSE